MRDFLRPRAGLRRLSIGTRLVYSTFILMMLAGFTSSILLADDGPGWTSDSATRYYTGEDPTPAPAPPIADPTPTGPDLDLDLGDLDLDHEVAGPTTPASAPIAHARSYRVLLENTHRHLYMMPVIWLILAHLFLLTRMPRPVVATTVAAGGLGVVSHIAAPWVIRYLAPSTGWLMGASGAVLAASFGFMAVWSLVEMWGPHPPARPHPPAPSPI